MQQQPSIFEPLFSRQVHTNMELMMPSWQAPEQAFVSHASSSVMQLPPHDSSSWFTTTPAPPPISSLPNLINIDHAPIHLPSSANNIPTKLSSNSSATRIMIGEHPSSTSDKVCKPGDDDGSVASKLLSSITKSISNPSLQLPTSKEATRETSYQKSLKLKQLKLQHCAEALGMESADSSLTACDDIISQCSLHERTDIMIDTFFSPPQLPPKLAQIPDGSLTSLQSAPNLNARPTNMTRQYSKYTRCASFPPPLSHTLPSSPSCDSLSPSLRAYRQDGRFILKEVMVPSKNYFHANRRDGRLTLHIFTRDDGDEENLHSQYQQQGPTSKDSGSLELKGFNAVEEECKGMVSFSQATQEDDCGGDELISTNRTQVPAEDVLVKASKTIAELFKGDFTEMPVAASSKAAIPEKVQCIATCRHQSDTEGVAASSLVSIERAQHIVSQYGDCIESNPGSGNYDKINVMALILQITTNYSDFTLHKAPVLSSLHPSRSPLLSLGSMKPSTITHPPGYKSLGLSLSHHDMSTFSQSKENFVWESNLRPCATVQYRGCSSDGRNVLASRGTAASALVKSVMRMVTELATVGGRDCCPLAKGSRKALVVAGDMSTVAEQYKDNLREAILHSDQDGNASTTLVDAYSALSSVVMGVGVTAGIEEYINVDFSGSGISAHPIDYNHLELDDIKTSHCIELAGTQVSTSSFPYSASSLPAPSSNAANFVSPISDEWLHSLHSCKELSDYRNQFNMTSCFMKPHCIATRS